MKKSILVTAVLVGTLVTGAFAFGGNGNCDGSGQKTMKNQQAMQQQTQKRGWHGYKMRQKGIQHHNNIGNRGAGMQMFAQLNLTDEQQFQLSILRDEMRLEMKKLRGVNKQGQMLKFVNENGFDKKAFMKDRNEMQTKRLALKAEHMEKVFKILTKEQIAELKKNLNNQ